MENEEKNTISESEAKEAMENAEEIELTEQEAQENIESAEILEVVPDENTAELSAEQPEAVETTEAPADSENAQDGETAQQDGSNSNGLEADNIAVDEANDEGIEALSENELETTSIEGEKRTKIKESDLEKSKMLHAEQKAIGQMIDNLYENYFQLQKLIHQYLDKRKAKQSEIEKYVKKLQQKYKTNFQSFDFRSGELVEVIKPAETLSDAIEDTEESVEEIGGDNGNS